MSYGAEYYGSDVMRAVASIMHELGLQVVRLPADAQPFVDICGGADHVRITVNDRALTVTVRDDCVLISLSAAVRRVVVELTEKQFQDAVWKGDKDGKTKPYLYISGDPDSTIPAGTQLPIKEIMNS